MPSAVSEHLITVQIVPSVRPLLQEYTEVEPALVQVVSALLAEESDRLPPATPLEVHFLLTDDSVVQALNRQYRGVDRPTDVLSFGYLESPSPVLPGQPVWLGEVVISVPMALRQAAPNGHDAITEILMLALHGTLHLLGYTDETEAEQLAMNQRACAVLRAFGYPAKEVWYSRYDEN